MPNVISSGTTVVNGTIKKNNFLIGVNTSVGYGPTSATTFWNGIIPAASGYTVYAQKVLQGPSIRTAANDSELIIIAKQYGGTNITTVYDALSYLNSQTNFMVTNIDYPSIVTSGLTLMLDAGYVPSYPTTGTTWTDLSGSGNDVVAAGTSPVYVTTGVTNSFYFNGDGYFTTSTPKFNFTTFTFDTWIYGNPFGNTPANPWTYVVNFGNYVVGTNAAVLAIRGLKIAGMTADAAGYTENTGAGSTLSNTTWYNVTLVYDGSNMYGYLNSTQQWVTSDNRNPNISAQNLLIGSGTDNPPAPSENFRGNIAIVKIYNRALSATEVLQNYNAFKSRFGL